jgi:hypothetical protein
MLPSLNWLKPVLVKRIAQTGLNQWIDWLGPVRYAGLSQMDRLASGRIPQRRGGRTTDEGDK